jgi:tol-pal system protein YbgF
MASGMRWTACITTCFALFGCASGDLVIKRQAEAEAKIEHLIQVDKKSEQRMNELSGQIQSLEDQAKISATRLEQLQVSLREVRIAQDAFAGRGVQAVTPKIEVVNPEPVQKTKDSGPPAEYVKAFGLYSANNFNGAIQAFEAFLISSPQSEFAANATYWIGECYYTLSDLPKSLAYFQNVVDSYPKSAKTPDALLKLGYTQAAMKERDKSMKTFEYLIKTYPSSPAASKARERLTAN